MDVNKIVITGTQKENIKNLKNALERGKQKLFFKNMAADIIILSSNLSAPEISRFFMDINGPFAVMIIINASSLYEDILYATKILSFCKNSFIALVDDTNILNENSALILSKKLNTEVCFYKYQKKKPVSAMKKDIYKFAASQNLSGYKQKYPDIISDILCDLENALYEKNEFLAALAPIILTSSKSDITKICNQVGLDILDNLKILKSICVAMEFFAGCGIKKSDVILSIKNYKEIFVSDLLRELESLKTKEKSFNFISKNLKCPAFIKDEK